VLGARRSALSSCCCCEWAVLIARLLLAPLPLTSSNYPKPKFAPAMRQEYALERSLDAMQAEWGGVVLATNPWRATGTSVLRGTDEIQQLLDDQVGVG